jgi:hypothetical protein
VAGQVPAVVEVEAAATQVAVAAVAVWAVEATVVEGSDNRN